MDAVPQLPPHRPQVLVWFWLYCVAGVLFDLACFVIGILWALEEHVRDEEWLMVGLPICFTLPFTVLFLIAPFLPRRPWVWIFDLVVLSIGILSCVCAPPAVLLLIFWLQPATKAWFDTGPA